MNLPVTFRPGARRDLLEQTLYLVEQASPRMAQRYLDAVRKTCEMLAGQRSSGRLFATNVERLKQLRRFPVHRPFQKYLIFYQPDVTGIDVVRILQGAREIEKILANEEAEE